MVTSHSPDEEESTTVGGGAVTLLVSPEEEEGGHPEVAVEPQTLDSIPEESGKCG